MSQENHSEEIDLGQLFKLIGNAFDRFFGFIGNIFKGIFRLVIQFLQFLRKHFWKFLAAGIIGIMIGIYMDNNAESRYRSMMVVEPNFNSAQQLYNDIDFYNELASQEEYLALAEALKITEEDAKNLRKFKIESFSDLTQKTKQFSEFILQLDSISQKEVDYDNYLKNFNNINSKFHKITVFSIDPKIAKKCQDAIVGSIENNQYFRLQKQINEKNLTIQDSIFERQLVEIDSLQKFYRKIKILEAGKPEGQTSINLAENGLNNSLEIELLIQIRLLKDEIVSLNDQKANTASTINIISAFPNKGALINDTFKKKVVLTPILLIGLVFIFLVIYYLNKYLKNYNIE